MTLYRFDAGVDLGDLRQDARRAMEGWDWSHGAFGHVLSLAAPSDLHPSARYRYHNYPCTGLLSRLPHLRAVFDRFACDKVSFRLLRREPASAYAWHTDRWKGRGVVRFQIPIASGPEAFLVTTDYVHESQVKGGERRLSLERYDAFARDNAGHVERHYLEPGRLHYFDTTRVHTLVNPGQAERVTLSFDLVANDWLLERFPMIAGEIGGGLEPARPGPGAANLALQWTLSRVHPLRGTLRRWRARHATDTRS